MSFYDDLSKFAQNVALIDECGNEITYCELAQMADEMNAYIEPRKIVFSLCKNNLSSIAGYLGVLRKRAVPLLLSNKINQDLLNHLFDAYQPTYVLAEHARAFNGFTLLYENSDYRLWKTNFNIQYSLYDDLALLLTTSGSTGSPKLVRQSYQNITTNTASIVDYLELTGADRAITTMPMNYTYGLSIIQTQLACGGSVVVTDATLFDKLFWQLLKKYKVTTFGGVPYTYEILKKMRFFRMQLPDLKKITQAGGKLARELSVEFADICQKKNIEFITMYGAAEATARMAYLPWTYAQKKAGSIGIAIPRGRFSIFNEVGQEVIGAKKPGELVFFGSNVTLGYAEKYQDLCLGDENQGILHTGDMAMRDEEGFYYIVGRKKRFLKLYGNRVNLDEVESMLHGRGYFSCACSGFDDHLKIYMTVSGQEQEVRELLSQYTNINIAAFQVSIIEKLPRSDAGKILYDKLVTMEDKKYE